jgi:hypothetical protein
MGGRLSSSLPATPSLLVLALRLRLWIGRLSGACASLMNTVTELATERGGFRAAAIMDARRDAFPSLPFPVRLQVQRTSMAPSTSWQTRTDCGIQGKE